MGRNKRKKDENGGGAPAWMVTYGDMMSLLLCFFVLLLSFSTISEKDFEAALQSFQGAIGILPQYRTVVQVEPMPQATRRKQDGRRRALERVARELERRLQVIGKQDDVDIRFDEEGGLKINLPSSILFASARADIKEDAYSFLASLAELLGSVPGAIIEVRGHTDSRRLTDTSLYRDNFDLSFARADTVARYLASTGNVELEDFEIIACGPGHPVATNDTPEGRQANRRVEVYVRGRLEPGDLERLREGFEALQLDDEESTG